MPGSIERRGRNSWSVRVYIGWDPLAKRRLYLRRTVRGTRRDAERLAQELLAARDRGELGGTGGAGRTLLAEYLEQWLRYIEGEKAPSTARRYRELAERWIVPFLGAYRLGMLRPVHVQGWVARLRQDGLAPATVRLAYAVLRRALEQGVKLGLLGTNPAARVTVAEGERYRPVVLSPEEVERLVGVALRTAWGPALLFAISTGLRIGEFAALRWRDVDLERRVVRVERSLQRVQSRWVAGPPKGRRGRTVVLPSFVASLLASIRQGAGPDDLVFRGPEGGSIVYSFREALRRLCRAAGVPVIRVHDLRHLSASLLLARGVHPKVVAERLGHATTAMTMETYSHILPGVQEEAAREMDQLLREWLTAIEAERRPMGVSGQGDCEEA